MIPWFFYSWATLSHVIAALKYSTAVPVIFLSALKYHVIPDSWTNTFRPLWLISSVMNSLYSFYWDVTRDWDLRYFFISYSFTFFHNILGSYTTVSCFCVFYFDSVFSRIFKFKNPHLCSNILYGRRWVRICSHWSSGHPLIKIYELTLWNCRFTTGL